MVGRLGGDEARPLPSGVKRIGRSARVNGEGGGERAARALNACVFVTCWPAPGACGGDGAGGARGERAPRLSEARAAEMTVGTRDTADRAHQVRGVDGLLVSSEDLGLGQTRARRYPRHQMTSRGVAFDSAFDELHVRQRALDGIAGVGGRSAMFASASASGVGSEALRAAAAEARRRGTSLPAIVKPARYVRGADGGLVRDAAIVGDDRKLEELLRGEIAAFHRGVWRAEA